MAKTIKANRRVVEDYQTLFVNRRANTMQSVVRPHPESGRHHYFRPNKKGSDIRMMLTDDTIRQHLEGEITVGLYAINPSTQRCKSVAIDADYKNSLKHLLKLQYHLTQDGVQPALEVSKRVGHLWVFLATSLLAMECRIYIHDLASWLGVPVKGSGLADGIEVFPKHDAIGPGDSGNPIRGPLGMHRGAGRRFWFYGADYTLEAQIEYLNGLRKVTEEELRRFMTGKELKVLIPKRFRAAVQAITKAVNCTGSPHNHFVRVRQEEEGPRQSGQLQVSEARKTRQQPMWLEREREREREVRMQNRLKNCALVMCLFVFLFVIIGGGLHLAPGGAFLAAVTGTPLVIFAFQRGFRQGTSHDSGRPATAREVQYVNKTTNKLD